MSTHKNPPRAEHVVACAGSRVHAWVTGPADGRLVVLCHGASMDHRMFDEQVGPLAEAGFRVLTWDMRGHGHSRPIGRVPVSITDLADDLLAVLDQLGAREPVCVGGQSLGGLVAQELAYRTPERVAALVIIGSTCITMPIARWERWALRSSLCWFRFWPWAHLKRVVAATTARRPQVRSYAREAIDAIPKTDFLQIWRGVTRSMRPDAGYRIEVPLLLTHGELDRTGNIARTAPAWAARDPHCRRVAIPRAGHNANQDNPGFFNRALLDFLSEHYPATA